MSSVSGVTPSSFLTFPSTNPPNPPARQQSLPLAGGISQITSTMIQQEPKSELSRRHPRTHAAVPRSVESRKMYRKHAEKARRELLKVSFAEVKQILPGHCFAERLPSNEKVLDKAREYIEDLRGSAQGKEQTVSEIEREIERLRFGQPPAKGDL
ncbi:hypothetical protein HDU98_007623 [Podochytrium sp. JEL0797]|nr:hypothetical protein HDU98_007623 [Podochytrium sp. JEL0797]